MPQNTTIDRQPAYAPQPAAPVRTPKRRSRARPRGGLFLKLRVHMAALELDTALAKGEDPLDTPELTLRAEQLNQPDTRRRFSEEIEQMISLAGDPDGIEADPDPEGPGAMFKASHGLFKQIGGVLSGPGPHPLHGVAMVSVLLRDQGGPLYADSVRLDDSRGPLYAKGHSPVLLQALKQTRAALDA